MRKNILLFITLYIFLLLLNILMPPQSDDIVMIENFKNPSKGFLDSYFTNNGRIGEIIYTGYFVQFNEFGHSIIFDILNSLMGSIFFFLVFILYFNRLPKSKTDFYSFFLIMILVLLFDTFGSTFLWGAGSFNYLWGISFVLLFLLPFRFFWQNFLNHYLKKISFNFYSLFFGIAFGIFAIIAGMASEIAGLTICFLLVLSFIFIFYKKIKIPFWYIFGSLGFWFGWILLFLSPGSNQRALNSSKFLSVSDFLNLNFLEQIIRINRGFNGFYSDGFLIFFFIFFLAFFTLKNIKLKAYQYALFILLIPLVAVWTKNFCAIIVYASIVICMLKFIKEDKKFIILLILFSVWLFMASTLICIENIPRRARFADNLLLFAIIIYIFNFFYERSFKKNFYEKIIKSFLTLALVMVMANSMFVAYSFNHLATIISKEKLKGNEEIVISKYYFKKYYPFNDWHDLREDKDWWINKLYSKFFGVKSIELK